jgi:hypothetical protein
MQLFTVRSNWPDFKTTNTERINKEKKEFTIHVYYTHAHTKEV